MSTNSFAEPPAESKPELTPDQERMEFEIAKQAQSSLIMIVLSFVALTPFLGGPGAIYFGNHALALIKKHGVGQRYVVMAKIGKIGGITLTVLAYGVFVVVILLLVGAALWGRP